MTISYPNPNRVGSSGGGSSPGGLDSNVQFNKVGALGGSKLFAWDDTTGSLKIYDNYTDASANLGWKISGTAIQVVGAGFDANAKNGIFGNTVGGGVDFQGTYFSPLTGTPDLGSAAKPWNTVYANFLRSPSITLSSGNDYTHITGDVNNIRLTIGNQFAYYLTNTFNYGSGQHTMFQLQGSTGILSFCDVVGGNAEQWPMGGIAMPSNGVLEINNGLRTKAGGTLADLRLKNLSAMSFGAVFGYANYTDENNWSRLRMGYSSDISGLVISTERAGTGPKYDLAITSTQHISITTSAGSSVWIGDGTNKSWRIVDNGFWGDGGGHIAPFGDNTQDIGVQAGHRLRNIYAAGTVSTGAVGTVSVTFANLPSSPFAGLRAAISDSTLTFTSVNIGSAAAGGGANFAPVIYNGSNWIIGG